MKDTNENCGSGGRRFEPGLPPKKKPNKTAVTSGFTRVSILTKLQSVYKSVYFPMFKKPKVSPAILLKKPPSSFSKKEKRELEKKRWYVYYDYKNPDTDEFKRQTPITNSVNRDFPDFDDRIVMIKRLRNSIEKILKEGWSPYKLPDDELYTTESILKIGLELKKKEVRQSTFRDYNIRVNHFIEFLKKQSPEFMGIRNVNKKIVIKYLDTIPGQTNKKNTKAALSSVFTVLASKDFIERNFIIDIKVKKAKPKPIRIYTEDEVTEIIKLLEVQDYDLLMFIYFVSYMFWRPIEIVRMRVGDVNFENNTIRVKTKTKESKIKIIPEILIDKVKEFTKDKNHFLFQIDYSKKWELNEVDKRNHFTRRFLRFRKKNNIDKDFKLYSFRHTYITKLYLNFRQNLSKDDTIKKLSLITGHTSNAIYNYIMTNDIELPDDYSDML